MRETMSHRERVMKTVEGEKTDRIPIDLGMHFSTGISVFAYKNLRNYLGMETDKIEIADNIQMLARVDIDILERFHIDTILLNPPLIAPAKWKIRDDYEFLVSKYMQPRLSENGEWIIERDGMKARMPEGGYFFDGDWVNVPLRENSEEEFNAFAKRAEWIYKETDYYTMEMGYPAFFEGIEQACDMYTEPESVLEFQNKRFEDAVKKFDRMNKAYGRYIQCIEVNSDLGAQNAPMIAPEMYQQFCVPYLKEFCRHVHKNSDIKVFIHSCGSIEPLIPYIIEAGVDILNPVQISAQNMEPEILKQKYGDKIVFWGGGCNTQNVLGVKHEDEVRQNVRELISIFKPNGRFVFNQVHNIMGNVPPQNVVAMLDEAYKNSFYQY